MWGSTLIGAQRAGSGFMNVLGGIERRVAGLGRVIKYNLLFGGFGLSAVFTGGIAAGIKFNATMEGNVMAFQNFLGSAKAAREEMAKLYEIAKTTPFEVPDVTRAARMFLAFGFTANQTNKYLRTLADAAAASGQGSENMQRITLALGQMQAKGRVQGDELLQLTEAGIPALKILQKELKLTDDQMQNIGMEHLKSSEAIPALMRGMAKLYAGASSTQAKTFSGLWSTLKDSVNSTLGAVTEGLFVQSKKWLKSLIDFSNEVEAVWTGPGSFGTKASKTWKMITDALTDWLDSGGEKTIRKAGTKMGEVLAGAVNAVFGVGGSGGGKSPFYRMGSTAVKSFASGFKDSLATGDILTSPLGRVLEVYFGAKLIRRLRNVGGGSASGGAGDFGNVAGDKLTGSRVYFGTPQPVYVVGGGGVPGGVPLPGGGGRAGGKIPGGIGLPYPGAPGGGGKLPKGGWWGRMGGGAGLARGLGNVGLGLMGVQIAQQLWDSYVPEGGFKSFMDKGLADHIAGARDWHGDTLDAGQMVAGLRAKGTYARGYRPTPTSAGDSGLLSRAASGMGDGGSGAIMRAKRNAKRMTAASINALREGSPRAYAAGAKMADDFAAGLSAQNAASQVAAAAATLSNLTTAALSRGQRGGGIPRNHGGGTFRARSRGGEGLAILRDGERVVPTSGSKGSMSRGGHSFHFHGDLVIREEADIQKVASAMATEFERKVANMSFVNPDD